jgi:hypothetical protein
VVRQHDDSGAEQKARGLRGGPRLRQHRIELRIVGRHGLPHR